MFLWLFLITVCVRPSLQTSRSPHGSTASSFRRRQILLVECSRVEVGGREGGRQCQNPVMIWLFCAAALWGNRARGALAEGGCWYVFKSVVFLLVARTIMGPHGISRAVQRLEFCDCKKGLGEHLSLDLTDLWILINHSSFSRSSASENAAIDSKTRLFFNWSSSVCVHRC